MDPTHLDFLAHLLGIFAEEMALVGATAADPEVEALLGALADEVCVMVHHLRLVRDHPALRDRPRIALESREQTGSGLSRTPS